MGRQKPAKDSDRDRFVAIVRGLSTSDQFRVHEITAQTDILRRSFPGIDGADERIVEQPLPFNAQGWFAIPRWQTVAETYGEAVGKLLELIRQQYRGKLHNSCEGKLGKQYLIQHSPAVNKLCVLADRQKNYDTLVVPAQLGHCHRSHSVRQVREMGLATNEFGLGVFEVGCILLTHLELFGFYDQWIDCPGDEFAPVADGDFSHAPYFDFKNGNVWFGTDELDNARSVCGSASGFIS